MAAEYLQRMGQRIAARREELGLKQEDVARALPGRTSGSHVSRWERGLHRPSDDTLEALAKVLEVDVAYFLAAQPDKSGGTPDLLGGQPEGQTQLDRIEQALAEQRKLLQMAEEERVQIRRLLDYQEELLTEITRVMNGLPDDEALRLLNEGAQQLLDAAQAGQAARGGSSAAPAETRRAGAGK